MVNTSKFITEHVPLCVCTLGLAILGYLGYNAVHWLINKCQGTENVDQVAQKSINNQPSAVSSQSHINRVSNLEISQDKITMGQGEYIVFHKLPTGEKLPLSRETFEQVYQVLLQHSPAVLSENAIKECANRYELIKAKLKEIDPTLEAVFIPRTLYELIFIRKCIQEDLKHKGICPDLEPWSHKISLKTFKDDQIKYLEFLKDQQEQRLERKCWHLCYFTDTGNNEHAGVKDVAYRLNNAILKAFDPSNECFTHKEFSALAEKEIQFLKDHYKNGLETIEKLRKGEKVKEVISFSNPGPTTNFGFDTTRGTVKPMGIRNEIDAQIIKDAIALDCSKLAQHSFFLYRGADFEKDSTSCWSDKEKPYSLSYGSSLFAGCLYDGGASAFHYMRNGQNAYAVPVAFDQLNDSPFFVPTTHTVAQLFGVGEIFHARTKAWKDFDVENIGGMNNGVNGHVRDHLKSNLNQDELTAKFQEYKNKAVQLK
jgi:hypothetical protein